MKNRIVGRNFRKLRKAMGSRTRDKTIPNATILKIFDQKPIERDEPCATSEKIKLRGGNSKLIMYDECAFITIQTKKEKNKND